MRNDNAQAALEAEAITTYQYSSSIQSGLESRVYEFVVFIEENDRVDFT